MFNRSYIGFLVIGLLVFQIVIPTSLSLPYGIVERKENLPNGNWQISHIFYEFERMSVNFPFPEVCDVPNGGGVRATLLINITIQNNVTRFRVDFKVGTNCSDPICNVSLQETGALIIDSTEFGDFNDSLEYLGGIAKYTGNYSVKIYSFSQFIATYYYPPNGTLTFLELLSGGIIPEFDHWTTLLVMITMTITATIVSKSIRAHKKLCVNVMESRWKRN